MGLISLWNTRKRESYLSFEYEKIINSPYNTQNLIIDQNLSSEDKMKVSGLLSDGISLFFSIWEKDSKTMPSTITKENYNEYTLDKYNPAIEYFDKVLTLDKDNTQAFEYKAHSLFLNRYFEEAIEIYRIVSKEKNDSVSWNDLGVALMEYGLSLNKRHKGKFNLLGCDQLEEAIKCFELALSKNPKNICSTLNLAHLYHSTDNFLAASFNYNRALEPDENNIHVLINAAKNYLSMDLFSESKELYNKAIEIDPSFMKNYFDDSASSICTDGYDDLMFLKMGIEINPDSPIINSQFIEVSLRRLLHAKNKDGIEIEDIIRSGRKLIELDEHDYVLLELAGIFLKHFPDDCLEILDKINLEKIIETTSPSNLSYYGSILSDNGRTNEAMKFYEKSLNAIDNVLLKIKDNYYISRPDSIFQDKDNYYVQSLLEDKLSILIDIGRYEEAKKSLNQLKEYGIDESEYSYRMGLIYYNKAETEKEESLKNKFYIKARRLFDDYLRIKPSDSHVQLLRIDSLKNYSKEDSVLSSIRDVITEKLSLDHYVFLINISFELKDFSLCDEIKEKALASLEGKDKLEIYNIYDKIHKYIHLKDEKEKEKLKEDFVKLQEENKKLIQKENKHAEFMDKLEEIYNNVIESRKENREGFKITYKKLDELKEMLYTYSSKLDEIKNSTDTIDKKVDKIHNQTSKTSNAIREKYPELFEEKKKEIRKKLGI